MEFAERIATAERIAKVIAEQYPIISKLPTIVVKATVRKLSEFRQLQSDGKLLELVEAMLLENGMTEPEVAKMKKTLGL